MFRILCDFFIPCFFCVSVDLDSMLLSIGKKLFFSFTIHCRRANRIASFFYNSDSLSFDYYRLNLGCSYLFMRDRLSRTCFLFEKSIPSMGSLTMTRASASSKLIVLNSILYHNRYCLSKEELLSPLPQLQ